MGIILLLSKFFFPLEAFVSLSLTASIRIYYVKLEYK